MYSTSVYIYQQKTRVLLIDTEDGLIFNYRYDPVYAKKLTINKGVDNVILFEFINQDEKPVNITGSSFIFRLVSTNGAVLLLEKPMEIINAPFGRAKVTLTQPEVILIEAQPASYSISRHSGNLTEAVFTDAQAGARAPVDIVNSILPQFIPSSPLTIPTTQLSSQVSYGGTAFGNWPGWGGDGFWGGNGSYFWQSLTNTEFYSSFIEPRGPLTTVQMDLLNYTGTIKAQAAENYQSIPYNVTESRTYYNYTGTIHWNIVGWHPILRMCFNNSIFATPNPPGQPAMAYAFVNEGLVEQIIVQNPGAGYIAPPRVDIIGDGSGATAEATINQYGVVTGITVTNPGSGYWPIPVGGYNTIAYPVPPQNQGAFIVISTGYIVNLYYR
jgi:hypothetical protein